LELSDVWFGADEAPVFVAVGRLSTEKNFSMLITAFEQCRSTRPCRLLILGEGPARSALEQQIAASRFQDDIRLAGFCANPYAYMRNAAALVLSSNTEGLPTVLMEALACNTQIIATDCPHGPREILQHGLWGTLVPVGDVQALALAMSSFLQQPSQFAVAERAGTFSIESATAQYLELIFGDAATWPISR
jgi:glycosyltransferase involved in cell wall biosynthesis